MFEQWQYTIPANTSETNRKKQDCRISIGLLTDLEVYFPYGCQYYARCRVFLGEKPILPRSAKSHIQGEGSLVPAHNLKEIIRPNLPVLKWELWNLDETYDHTLTLSATWISQEEATENEILRTLKRIEELYIELKALMTGRRIA